jgi:histidine triad (HIT) family protein
MPCTFCRIVDRTLPAFAVLEDTISIAFLDSRPLFPGHCLLVPRDHVETLADLPAELVGPFFANAQRLSLAIEAALGAEGTFVAINNRVSQSVPHLHVHVVPRRKKDGLKGFFWPRHPYASDDEARGIQERVRAALGER